MTSTHLTGATELPDGTWVRGRGLRHPEPTGLIPDYGLYLGGPRLRARHDDKLTWPHQWVDWPDFLLPRDSADAVARIRELRGYAGAGHRVEVACHGGKGRTGTVVACLAILAGVPAGEAVRWARVHYDRHAGETPWQRRWVLRFPSE
jgi:Protein-tyrosine phosphatase